MDYDGISELIAVRAKAIEEVGVDSAIDCWDIADQLIIMPTVKVTFIIEQLHASDREAENEAAKHILIYIRKIDENTFCTVTGSSNEVFDLALESGLL